MQIRTAAVIGSGTMGSGIAALLAGVGIETLLLDLPAPDTAPGDLRDQRDGIARAGLAALRRARPPALFSADDLALIDTGNIEDDLDRLAAVDWVIEVVVERLEVKRDLMARLAAAVGPQTIISTNTSGLSIRAIAAGLGPDFTRRFLGTHFFNPPRHLYLLELIPHPQTDPTLIDEMQDFMTRRLGKGVVLCEDTPNFIANRFLSMNSAQAINYALNHGYTVAEVDALTGPLIGRPKTATFNLYDLVGFDVMADIAHNLHDAIPDDPAREVLNHPKTIALSEQMLAANRLGRKTEGGFYQMRRGDDGARELWTLNLATFDYEPPADVHFDSVARHRAVKDLGQRIRLLMAEDDRAGGFLWHHLAFYLAYASNRVPEITANFADIDRAMRWGLGHQLGPFELWDAIGVNRTVPQFEAAGYPVADWVKRMISSEHLTFYLRDDRGQVKGQYDPDGNAYVPLKRDPRVITAAGLPEIARNPGASLRDMGDGVGLLVFQGKQNTLDNDVIALGHAALDRLERGELTALVVGNDGERFSIGLNLANVVAALDKRDFAGIEQTIHDLQLLAVRMRTAAGPVVTAPVGLTLGGGAEIVLGGIQTIAHAELYIGLVEVNVGLIPAGGGCAALLRRVVNPVMQSSAEADPLPHLQQLFHQIMTAAVSHQGAKEARALGFLGPCDRVVLNRRHLLREAKRSALYLADGYVPARSEAIYAAGRDAHAALLIDLDRMHEQDSISDYDVQIGRELAHVLTGGAPSSPAWIDEMALLDLERAAFMRLLRDPNTQARISHMLKTNQPLRN
jgi:3-hydroxyacyl-CoA dehydrogenase